LAKDARYHTSLDEWSDTPSNSGVTPPDQGQGPSPESGLNQPDGTEAIPGAGPLLEEPDEKKVFKAIHQMVIDQEKLAKNREAQAKHWGRVRRGIPFSTLVKSEDRGEWKAELPPGISDTAQPIPNKADDLCSRIVSQVVVDQFQPDPKPENDSDEAREAAELCKRFLRRDGDESGTNDGEVFRVALDTSMTHASSFVHLYVDPQGDGWRPLRIKAHPQATDGNNPLIGPDGMPSTEYVLRHVTESGQFTDNPAEAARQWLPKIRAELLDSARVRTVPETADVHSAQKVILLMVAPLSDAKARFPVLKTMEEQQLRELTGWRPQRSRALVPDALRGRWQAQNSAKGDAGVSDEALLFWYQSYCRADGEYQDGAEIAVNGALSGTVLKRATLRTDVPISDDGALKPVVRSIPVSQCRPKPNTVTRDPFGAYPIEVFGPTNEAFAQLYGGMLADVDRRLNPNVFLTATSSVQPPSLSQRTDPIFVLSKDDMPMYEEFAELPAYLPTVLTQLATDMATAAGLGDTMNGLDSPNAKSGIAKETVIRQAKVALSTMYHSFASFVKRYWRLKLELGQCFLTVPQQAEHTGDDSAAKQRWWVGADLVGVADVAIAPGTGTMMSPAEKQQFLLFAQQAAWVSPDEAAEVGRSTVSDDLGIAPNPHSELIGRQLAAWTDGPPDGWMPEQPMMDPATMMPVADEMGQPMTQPPSWTPFEPRPSDDDPEVALLRYRKLRAFMAGSDYQKQPPEWRLLVDNEYTRARQAAGIATIAEQQMAMQQQAQMQADQQAADAEGKAVESDKNRAFQGEQAERDRAQERSEATQDRALEIATMPPQQAAGQ
jgi:hypothetical protein